MKNLRHTRRAKTLHPLFSLAVLSVLVAGCSTGNNPTGQTSSLPAQPASSAASSERAAVTGARYADGTFSAAGNYTSPAGPESVNVTLTLQDGTITDATFQGNAQAARSQQMQGQFAAGFKQQVVGKSIDALALTVVNGSSLTPKGFMDAVAKIKAEAQA